MAIKTFLFDLDGTLVDSNADLAEALNYMRKSFQLPPLPLAKVQELLGWGIRELIDKSFLQEGIKLSSADLDRALKLDMDYYTEHIADLTRPYPGVVETLSELQKRNCAMALVTNKHAHAAEKILRLTGLADFMQFVGGDGLNLKLKPEPDLLLKAMEVLKADPASAVMVGDNNTDLGSARNAGIKSVFLTCGYGTVGEEKPDFVFNNISGLLEMV